MQYSPRDDDPFEPDREPDDEYAWNGGKMPNFGAYDGPDYRQTKAEPNIEALHQAFDDFCLGKGASEPTVEQARSGVLAPWMFSFTSIFSAGFIAKEEHSLYGAKESHDFGSDIGHCSRIDLERNKLIVLAYSLKPESREFFLPTVIAQPLARSQAPWGSITMDLVESLNPFCDTPGAAGMIAEIELGIETRVPNSGSFLPFMVGPSKKLSLAHVVDLAEAIQGEKGQHHTPWVAHLPASIVVAFALTEISKRERILLGLTGVDLSDDERSLTVGAVVVDGDISSTRSFLLDSGFREKAYRFILDSEHPSVMIPRFLDTCGTLFGIKM